MQFTLNITLGNDAMLTPDDIAGALENAAAKLVRTLPQYENVVVFPKFALGPEHILDLNGERVGEYSFADPEPIIPPQAEGTIIGSIRLHDGTESKFMLSLPPLDDPDGALDSWQQWGATTERLYRTSQIVEDMQSTLYEAGDLQR